MLIYKITNSLTNKIYIGQTKKTLKERFASHKHHMRDGKSYLYNAMRKYGIENFIIEPVEDCATQEQLDEREIYWISFYSSAKTGYNITDGGHNYISNTKNSRPSRLGKYICSDETRKKISIANSGKNNGMYGKHRRPTDIQKQHISMGQKASEKFMMSRKSPEYRQKISNFWSKPTYILDAEFNIITMCKSVKDVAKYLKCNETHAKNFRRWKRKILKHFWLIYVSDYNLYKSNLHQFFNAR